MHKLKQQLIPIAPELQLAILMEGTCILVWIQPPPLPSSPATRPLLLKIPFNQRHYWHSLFSLGISNTMYMQSMEPLGHEHVVHKMCVLRLVQKLKNSYLFFFHKALIKDKINILKENSHLPSNLRMDFTKLNVQTCTYDLVCYTAIFSVITQRHIR